MKKKIKTYYQCNKLNHFIKNCYSKIQQQLNIIIKNNEFKNYD